MRIIIFLLCISSYLSFSQTNRDYKKYDLAVQNFKQGDLDKSKKILQKLLKKHPLWKQPILLMATISENEGDFLEAIYYLNLIYQKSTIEHLKGLERIANLYFKNGYYEKAKEYYTSVWKIDSINCNDKTLINIKSCDFAIFQKRNPKQFNPINLGSNINSEMREYFPAISIKGDKLVFTRLIEENYKRSQEDFYLSYKDQNNWIQAIPFPGKLNTNMNEGTLSFSYSDNKIVYTACDRKDSKGRCDLYIMENNISYNLGSPVNTIYWESQGVFSPDGEYLYFVSNNPGGYGGKDIWRSKLTNDGFSIPENLGPEINTEYDEISPFIHPDNLTLYFSSNGHIGMGDYDLFISRRNTTNLNWGNVENLGFPINTHRVENSLIVEKDGLTAYYTSDLSGYGKEDIFTFTLPREYQAKQINNLELEILSNKAGDEVILNNVNFSFNSFKLNQASIKELNFLIDYLIKNPEKKITIEGHTDNVGNEEDNLILSKKRAESVYNFLLNNGIKSNQLISFEGFGESKPIISNSSEKGREENRRTSFRLVQ